MLLSRDMRPTIPYKFICLSERTENTEICYPEPEQKFDFSKFSMNQKLKGSLSGLRQFITLEPLSSFFEKQL